MESVATGTTARAAAVPRGRLIASWIITGILTAFMLFDAVTKFIKPKAVADAFVRSGWPLELSSTIGALLLISLILWLIPRTAVLGALLLTAYLGGAVASNVRLEMPLFGYTLFPVYFGVLIWGAMWLCDPQIRSLIPLRKNRQR